MCVGLADPENTVVRYVDSLHYSNWPFKQEATNLAVVCSQLAGGVVTVGSNLLNTLMVLGPE